MWYTASRAAHCRREGRLVTHREVEVVLDRSSRSWLLSQPGLLVRPGFSLVPELTPVRLSRLHFLQNDFRLVVLHRHLRVDELPGERSVPISEGTLQSRIQDFQGFREACSDFLRHPTESSASYLRGRAAVCRTHRSSGDRLFLTLFSRVRGGGASRLLDS